MHKNLLLLAASVLLMLPAFAQNIGINEDGSRPNANAILDLKSGNKGVLIPRMDSVARKAIPNTKGLLVYDISTDNFWYNTGEKWECIPNDKDRKKGGEAWLLKGNAATKDSVDFLGTTDNVPLNIRVNNQPSGRIDSASGNTYWGYGAGRADPGSNNPAIGSGMWNTANGYLALASNTIGVFNTAFGYESLDSNTLGDANSAYGTLSMHSNTRGVYNCALGLDALYGNTFGYYNTSVGVVALSHNTTGNFNTTIGGVGLVSNSTGSYNTSIGFLADVSIDGLTNATAIGNGATVDASNKVRIGNSAVTVIEGQVPFTTPSDGRYKFNVQEDVKGLDFILQLRPVTYQFDTKRFDAHLTHQSGNANGPANYAILAGYDEATRIRRSGFIAQEVEQAANASGYDFSGIIKPKTEQDHYSLSYDAFVVPLVKAVQEQQQIILQQNKKLEEQDKKLTSLQAQLDEIKKLLHPAN